MKIFQTPSYDRFCLFEMERKSKDFRGMDDNVAYKNKQIDNVEISNEGRRALREKLREVKPKVEEPIGYELTIQDTNEVEWEHYTSMREYSGLTLKDGKYNLEDVMKSMMDAYETRYNYIVKEHENGERQVSYDLTGENSLTLDEDLAGLDRAYNKRLANLAGYIVCQQTNDGSKFFQTTNVKKNTAEQKEYIDTAVSMMEKAQKRFLEMREEPKYTAGIPNRKEYEEGWYNLEKADFQVDYILTHSGPREVVAAMGYGEMSDDEVELRQYLQRVADNTDFTAWYFGHFHEDTEVEEMFYCLYDDIVVL